MKLFVRIMSRFNVSPELIGDIAEDSPSHSTFWLLHQSVSAILSTVSSSLWNDKRQTFLALVIPWAATFGWVRFLLFTALPAGTRFNGRVWDPATIWMVFHAMIWVLFFMATFLVWPGLMTWLAARLHRAQPLGAAFLLVASFLVEATYNIATSWTEMQHRQFDQTTTPLSSRFLLHGFMLASMLLGCFSLLRRPTGSPTPD